MNKKELTDFIFYLTTTIIIIISFIIFHPKIGVIIFGFRRNNYLKRFIAETKKNNRVDVEKFWQLREFYCPGFFIFDKNKSPFLTYRCPWMTSDDYLVDQKVKINYQIKEIGKKINIEFTIPVNEMKKVNGFFDYNDKDKAFVANKYWQNKTVIFLN